MYMYMYMFIPNILKLIYSHSPCAYACIYMYMYIVHGYVHLSMY